MCFSQSSDANIQKKSKKKKSKELNNVKRFCVNKKVVSKPLKYAYLISCPSNMRKRLRGFKNALKSNVWYLFTDLTKFNT